MYGKHFGGAGLPQEAATSCCCCGGGLAPPAQFLLLRGGGRHPRPRSCPALHKRAHSADGRWLNGLALNFGKDFKAFPKNVLSELIRPVGIFFVVRAHSANDRAHSLWSRRSLKSLLSQGTFWVRSQASSPGAPRKVFWPVTLLKAQLASLSRLDFSSLGESALGAPQMSCW